MFRSPYDSPAPASIRQIDAVELAQMIERSDDLVLVDVRSASEFQYDGHIEGAQLYPLPEMRNWVGSLPEDKLLVFVCRSGNRSQVAAEQMARLGYHNVANFRGGMVAWKLAGYAIR
jgi:rhodanese-related sulfurtransferase